MSPQVSRRSGGETTLDEALVSGVRQATTIRQ